jgi:PPOX class probable F420-dependent enzyme
LTSQEATRLEELLAPSRIVVVATVGAGGMPQLTPNWYVYQGGRMAISTTKERIKYRNLSRDDRMAVCVYTEPGASDYVAITGRVTIADDESIWPVTQAIVERYVAPDGVDARMRTLRTENRVIISLVPDRVSFRSI